MNIRKPSFFDPNNDFTWRLFSVFCIFVIVVTGQEAFASSGDPVGDALCKVVKLLQGNVSKAIAIVAVIVLAAQVLRGQLKWEVAFVIVTGIVILFQAPAIVNMVSPDTASTDTCTTIGGTL